MTALHAIIPAGGAGTRLWPLSRRSHPKFLHDLTGSGRTMLQATVDRLAAVTDSITVVTGTAHAEAVRAQVPALDPDSVLAEPSPRDSMAAIGLAAAVLARRYPGEDVIVGSFAADHVITDDAAFAGAVRAAIAAAEAGFVATIGIEASAPSTAFGYIEAGAVLTEVPGVHQVVAFTEKPDAVTAAAYLSTGRYWWNAGMFVARATVLLDHLAAEHPDLAAGLDRIAAAWQTAEREEVLAREWPSLTAISIDHAIAEPVAAAGGVAVVPGRFGWDDVGDWAALRGVLRRDDGGRAAGGGTPVRDDGGRAAGGGTPVRDDGAGQDPGDGDGDGEQVQVLGPASRVLTQDADDVLVVSGGERTVVVIGIDDAVVVDTEDAVLVTTTDHAQQVKDIVARLKERGEDRLL